MLSHGHFGFSLILTTLLSILLVKLNIISLEIMPTFCLLIAVFSFLPDLDLYWLSGYVEHRGPATHSILFAIIVAIGAFAIMFYLGYSLYYSMLGFLAGFLAVLFHLIGDLFTYEEFQMFYPFSKDDFGGWELFHSGHEEVNHYLLVVSIIFFAFVYTMLAGGFT
jgi:membrane-bound metal-dependent hydrolase YbcI (DUF457 family)